MVLLVVHLMFFSMTLAAPLQCGHRVSGDFTFEDIKTAIIQCDIRTIEDLL